MTKNYFQIANNKGIYVDPKELVQARKVMLDMLLDIDKLCKQHNLTYFLAYGTCLGAIRHQGFIPWDDDIDIVMPRESFDKFCHLIDTDYNARYDITSPVLSASKRFLPFAKIYKKNTLYLEKYNLTNPFPKGVFIDIFPFDYLPISKRMCKVAIWIFWLMEETVVASRLEWFRSENSVNKIKKEQKIKFYGLGGLAKLISLFIPLPAIRALQTKLSTLVKKSEYVSCYFNDKPYRVKDIFPVSSAQFEGHTLPVPHNVHNYLTTCFDEHYMQLPPEEKRVSHGIIAIKL